MTLEEVQQAIGTVVDLTVLERAHCVPEGTFAARIVAVHDQEALAEIANQQGWQRTPEELKNMYGITVSPIPSTCSYWWIPSSIWKHIKLMPGEKLARRAYDRCPLCGGLARLFFCSAECRTAGCRNYHP